MPVLFDLDDTLVNHSEAFRLATDALYDALDVQIERTAFVEAWSASHRRHFDRYLAGQLSYEGQRRARIRDVTRASTSDDEADRMFATYLAAYEASWSLYPDVLPCLDALVGHQLGIVTNGQPYQQRAKLARTSITERFDCIVVSTEVGVAKPDPRIFQHACTKLRASPGDVVYVGDNYELDAVGARGAGLRGVWLDRRREVTRGHQLPYVHSLGELASMLERA